jgi:acyl-CoA synthetase (AMP-forming)/AMP-acid ligase II
VGAVVVLRPGQRVSADELADHVRARLAAFNVPTRFWFRSTPLPRNPAGKLLKRALRSHVLEGGEGATADWGGDPSAWDVPGPDRS